MLNGVLIESCVLYQPIRYTRLAQVTYHDSYLLGWVKDSCQATKLLPGHPLTCIYTLQKIRSKFDIHRYHFLSLEVPQLAGPRACALAMRSA